MPSIAIQRSADLLEVLADLLRNGSKVDEDTLDSVKKQVLLSQESLNNFIAKSNIKIIGNDTGRSKSTYIRDCHSYKRVYDMLKSQVAYCNYILKSDDSKKVLIFAPEILGGTGRLSILGDSSKVNIVDNLTKEEELLFGINKNNSEDHRNMRWVHEWILDRVCDKSRVKIIDGNRQLFKENSIKTELIKTMSDGCTNVCFFFKPVRNHRRFKYECASLKNCSKYSDAELRWITWVMDVINEYRKTDIEFAFSRDYKKVVNDINLKYGCSVESSEFITSEDSNCIVKNRIDYEINTNHENKNDECFHNMVNYFKSELDIGNKKIRCSIEQLMSIMDYKINKPSNVEYKLNKKIYNDIFNINWDLIHKPKPLVR